MARSTYIRTKYLDASMSAFKVAIDAFNSPINPYRLQAATILMVNAIELISKSFLLKLGESIQDKDPSRTITAEKAVSILFTKGYLDETEHQTLQQLISLRNETCHSFLDKPSEDIVFYLIFCAVKIFKATVSKQFRSRLGDFKDSFLSISTDQNITYAEGVLGLMKSSKRDAAGRRMLYLLERGVRYNGSKYISQELFEKEYKAKHRKNFLNRVAIGKYLEKAEQLRVVFIQAPKNHSIDISVGKNSRSKNILSVNIKTRLECDKTIKQIAKELGIRPYDVQKFIKDRNIKGRDGYHQEVPSGDNPSIHRYSEKLVELIKKDLNK